MAHQARSLLLLPIIVLGFSVLGGVYGSGVQAPSSRPTLKIPPAGRCPGVHEILLPG